MDAAGELIDGAGADALTLAALAERFGVKTPSLYAHVQGIDDVREAVRLQILDELADALQRAAVGRAGADALRAVAHAYRAFARRHPGRYALSLRGEAQTAEVRAVASRILETVTAVLRGYGYEGTEAVHATRALRSALHGFVSLELTGGFAMDVAVDETFERYVDMLDVGLREGESRTPPVRMDDASA